MNDKFLHNMILSNSIWNILFHDEHFNAFGFYYACLIFPMCIMEIREFLLKLFLK